MKNQYRTMRHHTTFGALIKFLYWQAVEGGFRPAPKVTHHIHAGIRYI